MAEFRLRQYVSHIDYYVIFLSLHLLTEKSLFGCIVTFFTVILKRNIACIVHIVYIYEGIFKLSVGCHISGKKQVTLPEKKFAIVKDVVLITLVTLSNAS